MSKHQTNTIDIVIKSLPTPIIVLDSQLKTTTVNRAFKNIFDQHLKVIRRGQSLKSIFKGHEDLYLEVFSRILDHESDTMFIHNIQNKTYEVTVTIVKRTTERIFITMHDVSQREELETIRRKFISNVAHELRTPLAAASSYAELLAFQDDISQDEVKESATYIYDELQRLGNLVNDLFEISKYDNNQIKLRKSEFNINDLIMDMQSLYKNKTPKVENFKLTYSSIDLDVYADYDRMKQVLINLMDNAFTYTKDIINVTVVEKKNKVRISVVDNGGGLTLEQKEKVFNRFYRTDYSRARISGGSGLGLAIVKEFVSLHGGNVYIHSELEQGSEFVIEIPVK